FREKNDTLATVPGMHLEGPYFSPAQCGAQDIAVITAPITADYTRLIAQYGKHIARWSYAPERDVNKAFLSALCCAGILPSAGHTNAIYSEMSDAADNGCKLVTHLYSCTSTVTRENCFRRGGVLEAVLLRDDMVAELIADGCHLPPELIQLVHKVKGADNVVLCTDALPVTGTDATQTFVGGVACIVEDGVCKLQDRTAFAGSIATADRLLRFCVQDVGLPIEDVSKMLSATPARLLGLPKGKLADGWDADIVVLNDDLMVHAVFAGGKRV
ncbi:MAG: amidohydrolase family protein, partial [Clostridia bacterium]|nr:amidohydrolase family protein [Clostridia bacterium]